MYDKEKPVSMESVLASIREMIQQEEKHVYIPSTPSSSSPEAARQVQAIDVPLSLEQPFRSSEDTEEVLELHHQIQDDGSVKNIASPAQGGFLKENALEGWDISSNVMDKVYETPHPSSLNPQEHNVSLDLTPADSIVSPAAAQAATSSFTKLAETIQEISQKDMQAKPLPSLTVEELVLKALRPMLKEWVDDNLPALAETIVSKEIKKLIQKIHPET